MSPQHREFIHTTDGEELSCTSIAPQGAPRPNRVVIMHGAGTGSKQRNIPLARDFADVGHPTLAFDFSGHGQSTGQLSMLSLERRFIQARSVIDEFAPDGPLTLVGFSMSGQTIADLMNHYGKRVTTIVLGAPAAYAPQAWKLPFGAGFTEVLRTARSWEDSSVFATFGDYEGLALLVVPEFDGVIPPGVTFRVENALRRRAVFSRITFPGSPHALGLWLHDHPKDRARIVEMVTPS